MCPSPSHHALCHLPHGHPFWCAHFKERKWPPSAAFLVVCSSHGHLFSCKNCSTSRCRPIAALAHVFSSNGQFFFLKTPEPRGFRLQPSFRTSSRYRVGASGRAQSLVPRRAFSSFCSLRLCIPFLPPPGSQTSSPSDPGVSFVFRLFRTYRTLYIVTLLSDAPAVWLLQAHFHPGKRGTNT